MKHFIIVSSIFLLISINRAYMSSSIKDDDYPRFNPNLFTNSTTPRVVISEFEGKPIDQIRGIVEAFVNGSRFYYVTDWGNDRIVKIDENGTFIESKKFFRPVGLTASRNFLYYTGAHEEFYQLDFDMNIVQKIKHGAFLEQIYYDLDTDYLYIADEGEPPIDNPGFVYIYQVIKESVFILNKTLTIDTVPYAVMNVQGKLYIGDENNNFLVYQNNKEIGRELNLCTSLLTSEIWSIFADIDGNVAFPCFYDNLVYLYSSKGQYGFIIAPEPRSVYLDSTSRFMVGTATSLLIYY